MTLDNQNVNDPPEISEETVADDIYVLNQIKRMLAGSRDQFGKQVRLNVQNLADIASHYPYSPERFRVFVDGSRQFIEYDGEPAQYADNPDSHALKPQSDGEVVTLETAEVYRYAVQYVIEWSVACQTNQALQAGDVVTVGYGDADLANSSDDTPGPSADGWFFIWDSDLATNEVRIAQYRDGTEQDASVVTTSNAITDWTRYASETNWYSVGAAQFRETYTGGGQQFNDRIGGTSVDGEKGPLTGNQPIQVSVKVGSAGAGSLEAEVGSLGVRYYGDIEPIFRRKTSRVLGTSVGSSNTFEPIYAIRTNATQASINTQLTDIDVAEFSGSGDVQVVAFAVDPSNALDANGNPLGDGNYTTPVEQSESGSVIEESRDIAQIPNSTGSTVTSTKNPGGYQEGYGSLFTSGTGSKAPVTQAGQQAKRAISERDVIVFAANATATGDINFEYTTEQQW